MGCETTARNVKPALNTTLIQPLLWTDSIQPDHCLSLLTATSLQTKQSVTGLRSDMWIPIWLMIVFELPCVRLILPVWQRHVPSHRDWSRSDRFWSLLHHRPHFTTGSPLSVLSAL